MGEEQEREREEAEAEAAVGVRITVLKMATTASDREAADGVALVGVVAETETARVGVVSLLQRRAKHRL